MYGMSEPPTRHAIGPAGFLELAKTTDRD